MCVDRENFIYLILPGNSDSSLEIMQASPKNDYKEFETVWRAEEGFDGEPLVDVQRLETSNVLSIFTRTSKNSDGISSIVVLDFQLR
jgi:D-alanine-D-alanine ligase-like ATP-grasp enzyme